jgi:hypothetical protein
VASKLDTLLATVTAVGTTPSPQPPVAATDSVAATSPATTAIGNSYATILTTTLASGGSVEPWKTVHYGRSAGKHANVRIRGSRNVTVDNGDTPTIKAVPRKPVLSAFVSRLHHATSQEGLTKYLMDAGMRGVVCRKIQPKDGRKFSTAAFQVTCSLESADLFYDEKCWPDGVELRDWVYK